MLNATDEIITTKPDYPNWTEINFCKAYFRINIFSLLIMSVTQVYISGLQDCKKRIIAIGAICSNFVNVIVVCFVLYVFKLNSVYGGLSVTAANFAQLIYMMIMNFKYIDYKNQNFKELVKFKFVIETVKIGLTITLEMNLCNICNFVMLSAITNVQLPVWYDP
ncbi:hypothetical protein [Mesoplasma melaleucae]|uniref:Polysaccharide biosynthesis protein C-terminal domain-containing protein n=1 Tax=Mesoplasma melaleucae TaxID=81459 RepID=A0A2K8NV13_9MOLU|nr:hypothetical protein [Mesoplasma melaleucae]ATZ17604.1 hypothetical protein EMELA_v1c00090 [Mesoplasma melaleucae]